jgi:hypothetical protein
MTSRIEQCRLAILADPGRTNADIAEEVGCDPKLVRKARARLRDARNENVASADRAIDELAAIALPDPAPATSDLIALLAQTPDPAAVDNWCRRFVMYGMPAPSGSEAFAEAWRSATPAERGRFFDRDR